MADSRSGGLDRLTHTFKADQDFCEALAVTQPSEVARLLVYRRWAQLYLPDIQSEMAAMVSSHFPSGFSKDAEFWTLSLTGGTFKDLGLVPYLVVRGVIWDAGFAVRRSLENVGLLAHLWHDPSKAEFLSDPDTRAFTNAFVAEPDRRQADALKNRRIQKRFSASSMPNAMSDLYRLLSAYSIHGGSPKQLVNTQIDPTRVSCMFLNRPDPVETSLNQELEVFTNGCEMICIELITLLGIFGKRYGRLPSKAGEGGFHLTKLLERGPNSEMSRLIEQTLLDLKWEAKAIAD
jgi:hypothetical protein